MLNMLEQKLVYILNLIISSTLMIMAGLVPAMFFLAIPYLIIRIFDGAEFMPLAYMCSGICSGGWVVERVILAKIADMPDGVEKSYIYNEIEKGNSLL